MDAKTHYEVLGVPEGASQDHIRSSYRLKMLEYHPDLFQTQPVWVRLQAESEATKINAAYEMLNNAGKRMQYDAQLAWNRRPIVTPPVAQSVNYEAAVKTQQATAYKAYAASAQAQTQPVSKPKPTD